MKKFYVFAALFFFLNPHTLFANSSVNNAGFLPANIWYSKDPFFSEDKVRIYTVVVNGSAYDILGKVEFYDNGLALGSTSFSMAGNGRVQDLWVDWVAQEGKHTITARIVDAYTKDSNGVKRPLVLENIETGKSDLDIDLDTDKDGIGNKEDADDDNDTVLDVEEIKNATDPLKKDTDGDGVSDGRELELAQLAIKKDSANTTLQASSTRAVEMALGALKTVDGSIPVPIKEGVTAGTNVVERFRLGEGYQFRLEKESQVKAIEAIKEREAEFAKNPEKKEVQDTSDVVLEATEKPFAYVLFGLYAALQYVFEWQVVFYGIIFYALYRLLKWGIMRLRNR